MPKKIVFRTEVHGVQIAWVSIFSNLLNSIIPYSWCKFASSFAKFNAWKCQHYGRPDGKTKKWTPQVAHETSWGYKNVFAEFGTRTWCFPVSPFFLLAHLARLRWRCPGQIFARSQFIMANPLKKKTFQTCFLDTSIHITNGSKHGNMVQNGGVRSLIASCFWQCRC